MNSLLQLVLFALPVLSIPIADPAVSSPNLVKARAPAAAITCSDKSLAFGGWDVSNLVFTQTETKAAKTTTTTNAISVVVSNSAAGYKLTCNGQWKGSSSSSHTVLCVGGPSPVQDPEDGSIAVMWTAGKLSLGVKQSWYCEQSLASRFWASGTATLKPTCQSDSKTYAASKVTTCKLKTGFVPMQEIRAIA